MAQALLRLTTALGEGRELRAKFKLFNIDASEENFTTRHFLETSTHGDDRGASMNATWLCRRSYPGDGSPAELQLLSMVLEAYELIAIGATGGQLFADCTASAIGHNDSYRDQVLPGIDHWLAASVDAELRDGAEVVRHAERAAELTGRENPIILDTLSAAYAEAGRFEDAILAAAEALELATTMERQDLADGIREHLELYEQKQPVRDP